MSVKILLISCLLFTISFSQKTLNPEPVYIPVTYSVPTNANLASPENVLIVYKENIDEFDNTSYQLAEYYRIKRNIPTINMYGLNIPPKEYYNGHKVILINSDYIIHDENCNYVNATNEPWLFYNEFIFQPIQNYLNNTIVDGFPLKNKIRYIVLMKGIPMKLTSRGEWSGSDTNWQNKYRYRESADALLCFLNQSDPNFSPLSLFGTYHESIANPYFNIDKTFSYNFRFVSNHFENSSYLLPNGQPIKLNYLVSRLDGQDSLTVINLIDKLAQPDMSGDATFILDKAHNGGDLFGYWNMCLDVDSTHEILQRYQIKSHKNGSTWQFTTSYPGKVMGYTSSGVHAGLNKWYVYSHNFNLSNGSVFNTYESVNGFNMDTNYRYGQSLITDFILKGGSGGLAHTYEPYVYTVGLSNVFYPSYALGYGMVDAAYQSMPFLAFQNIVIGDPLTCISYGKQELQNNSTLPDTALINGQITIPNNKTLTISNNSLVKFNHSGFINNKYGAGIINLGTNVNLLISSWDRGLIIGNSGTHPKLLWGRYPLEPVKYYKIYRHGSNSTWEAIDSIYGYEYIDTEINLQHQVGMSFSVSYKITGVPKCVGDEEKPCDYYETPFSNSVTAVAAGGLEKTNENPTEVFEYSLTQNYPNPFNPSTKISFTITKPGKVSLKVFNTLGQEVAILLNEELSASSYEVDFNASELKSGVYFYTIQASDFHATKKMILMK